VQKEYGERYRELYEKHWWWRARAEAILYLLRRIQPPEGWGTILDVGCGDGLFFDRLSQFGEVEGIDLPEALVNPTDAQRQRIHVGPFDKSFQPGKQYSLILMLDVLEHLPDPLTALRHALSLLKSEGTLLATVPAFRVLWTNHDVINHHFTRYTKGSFRQLARQAGLRIETERYWFHWTFPVKLASRLVERLLGLQPAPPNIPPGWLNESLYLVTRIEQKTLGALPVPFGSSLMVVGRKSPA